MSTPTYNWAAIVRYIHPDIHPDMPEPVMFVRYLGAEPGRGYFMAHTTLVVHGPYDAEGAALMTEHAREYFAASQVWELVWAGTDMDEARARHAALTALES